MPVSLEAGCITMFFDSNTSCVHQLNLLVMLAQTCFLCEFKHLWDRLSSIVWGVNFCICHNLFSCKIRTNLNRAHHYCSECNPGHVNCRIYHYGFRDSTCQHQIHNLHQNRECMAQLDSTDYRRTHYHSNLCVEKSESLGCGACLFIFFA